MKFCLGLFNIVKCLICPRVEIIISLEDFVVFTSFDVLAISVFPQSERGITYPIKLIKFVTVIYAISQNHILFTENLMHFINILNFSINNSIAFKPINKTIPKITIYSTRYAANTQNIHLSMQKYH